jgi:hypothetical protein
MVTWSLRRLPALPTINAVAFLLADSSRKAAKPAVTRTTRILQAPWLNRNARAPVFCFGGLATSTFCDSNSCFVESVQQQPFLPAEDASA